MFPARVGILASCFTLLALAACATAGPAGGTGARAIPVPALRDSAGGLPAVPSVHGPLALRVVYPDTLSRIEPGIDSSFAFGSTGDGSTVLTIDGVPIQVAPNGTWLAWVPFRGDSLVTLELEARTATDSTRLTWRLRRTQRFRPPPGAALWVDTTSFSPSGRVWWRSGEPLPISVRASEGAALAMLLPDGRRIPLASEIAPDDVPEGVRAFGRDTAQLGRPARADRYRGALIVRSLGAPLGPVLPAPVTTPAAQPAPVPDSAFAYLEAARGSDTIRVRWPLSIAPLSEMPVMAELDDDPERRGGTDGITVGRATPGGTYHWFFPAGTRARVTARINGNLRLGLSSASAAWVSASESRHAVTASSSPAVVGSIWMQPLADRVRVRVPVGARRPFQVEEDERSISVVLYGALSDVNWTRYGPDDPLITTASWRQVTADEVHLRFFLSSPVWGYRTTWEGTDLLLEVRRPPAIDAGSPLRGRTIVVDPGHPPAGATGVSGLTEAEANLGVSLELARMLEREGARVLLTRSDDRPVDLWPRVRFADSVDAELLVSIHNNALPDGINPFLSSGSSVFYNHPRAIPLARHIQRRFVVRFGTRDLGISRGDLALARPTWMPAVLTEGLFMMVPQQEAALRSEEGRRLYARAVLEGLREFLKQRAGVR